MTFDDNGKVVKKETTVGENEYFAFNEIYNDYIAFLVASKLDENGVVLGAGKFEPDDEVYAQHIGVFKPLFDEFFEEFNACKMNDDLHASIKKYIGFENFNKLAKVAYALLEKQDISEQEIKSTIESVRNSMRELSRTENLGTGN